jgi:hypothetical protein
LTRTWGKRDRTEGIMPTIARIAGDRLLRLFVVAGFGLALAGCDKCIMPTWQPNRAAGPPTSCHDDAPLK